MSEKIVFDIYFDGATSNNESKEQESGIGIVVYKDYEEVWTHSKNIGRKTNNEAEWTALITALNLVKKAQKKYPNGVFRILGDSQLVIRQFNGEYKVRDQQLLPYYNKAKEIAKEISVDFKVEWIERKFNKADYYAKKGKGK